MVVVAGCARCVVGWFAFGGCGLGILVWFVFGLLRVDVGVGVAFGWLLCVVFGFAVGVVCCVIVLGLVGVFARGCISLAFRVWFIVVLLVGWSFVCLVV